MPCDAALSLLPVALVVMGSAARMPMHLPATDQLLATCPWRCHHPAAPRAVAACLPAPHCTMPCSSTAPLLPIHPLPICPLHACSLSARCLLTPSSLPACPLARCPLACLLAAHHPLLAACPPTHLPASHHDAL
ncbi:hypothetical protein B0H10DRAFT_2224832 [Mycena sp. CBHHK59/15]|nr:hypothetical protein B0H10DRAFT_2224832 [Mycena sp. CBHHK59/15]